jgi:hypothetical protein
MSIYPVTNNISWQIFNGFNWFKTRIMLLKLVLKGRVLGFGLDSCDGSQESMGAAANKIVKLQAT